MTRLRTHARRDGFPICADCARREHLLIGQSDASDERCFWCGSGDPAGSLHPSAGMEALPILSLTAGDLAGLAGITRNAARVRLHRARRRSRIRI